MAANNDPAMKSGSVDRLPVDPTLFLMPEDLGAPVRHLHDPLLPPSASSQDPLLTRDRPSYEERVSEAQADLGGRKPETPEEPTEPVVQEEPPALEEDVLTGVISNFSQSGDFKQLAKRRASDPEVRKAGGIARCKALSKEHFIAARTLYLQSLDLPAMLPEHPTLEQQDAYDEGVLRWLEYKRDVLELKQSSEFASEVAAEVS